MLLKLLQAVQGFFSCFWWPLRSFQKNFKGLQCGQHATQLLSVFTQGVGTSFMSSNTDDAWSSNPERSQIFFLSTEVVISALQAVLHPKHEPSFKKPSPNDCELLKGHHKHFLFCAYPFRSPKTSKSFFMPSHLSQNPFKARRGLSSQSRAAATTRAARGLSDSCEGVDKFSKEAQKPFRILTTPCKGLATLWSSSQKVLKSTFNPGLIISLMSGNADGACGSNPERSLIFFRTKQILIAALQTGLHRRL